MRENLWYHLFNANLQFSHCVCAGMHPLPVEPSQERASCCCCAAAAGCCAPAAGAGAVEPPSEAMLVWKKSAGRPSGAEERTSSDARPPERPEGAAPAAPAGRWFTDGSGCAATALPLYMRVACNG